MVPLRIINPRHDVLMWNHVSLGMNTLYTRKDTHMIADYKPEVDAMNTRLAELRRYL